MNRSLILDYYAKESPADVASLMIPWLPDPGLLVEVVRAGFGMFDFFFLAIVLYQAWKIPAPFRVHLEAPSA